MVEPPRGSPSLLPKGLGSQAVKFGQAGTNARLTPTPKARTLRAGRERTGLSGGHLYIQLLNYKNEIIAGFNWDDGNLPKCEKHGVTIGEIESPFKGPMHVFPDPAHSAAEARYVGIGRSRSGRHLLIAFTYRELERQRLIRPISARFMHTKEVKHYEAQTQAPEETSSSSE